MNTPDTRTTRLVLLSPAAAVLVGGCMLVATAVYLGADWLRTPTLGMPAGVWAVMLSSVLVWYVGRSSAPVGRSGGLLAGLAWPGVSAARWRGTVRRILGILPRIAAWYGIEESRLRKVEDACNARVDRVGVSGTALRVGVSLPPALEAAVRGAESPLNVRWVKLGARPDGDRDCRELGLDAIVHASSGVLRIVSPESAGRDAAWYDWSRARPLSYSSVFPGRLDPARVTVADADMLTPEDGPAIRALTEAVAVLSRTPQRLGLVDRLMGRCPWDSRRASQPQAVQMGMLRMARFLTQPVGHPLLAPAARAVGAWLSLHPDVDAETRRLGVEAAARLLPDEPEAHLRLAAVRIADGYDQPALESLVTADRLLSARAEKPLTDQSAFIEAEAALPHSDPLTTGRVAAGVALVAGCSPSEQLSTLRDDLMDDLRYSGWLVGRDQDRALILSVFRALERSRAGAVRAAA